MTPPELRYMNCLATSMVVARWIGPWHHPFGRAELDDSLSDNEGTICEESAAANVAGSFLRCRGHQLFRSAINGLAFSYKTATRAEQVPGTTSFGSLFASFPNFAEARTRKKIRRANNKGCGVVPYQRFGVNARAAVRGRPSRSTPCSAALQKDVVDSLHEREGDDVERVGFGTRNAHLLSRLASDGKNFGVLPIGSP